MENTGLKACPFCGSEKVEVTFYNKPSVVCQNCWAGGPNANELTAYDTKEGAGMEAAYLWNKRAGDRQPAMPETVGVKALASATGSAARVEKERSLLLWMREVVAILAYQIDIPHQHKVDISEALDRYQKSLDAVEQQNGPS